MQMLGTVHVHHTRSTLSEPPTADKSKCAETNAPVSPYWDFVRGHGLSPGWLYAGQVNSEVGASTAAVAAVAATWAELSKAMAACKDDSDASAYTNASRFLSCVRPRAFWCSRLAAIGKAGVRSSASLRVLLHK